MSIPDAQRAERAWSIFAVALVYLIVLLVLTYPLVRVATAAFIGESTDVCRLGDSAVFLWNADVFSDNVRAGLSPFHTQRILYPIGADLWMHTYTPILGIVSVLGLRPLTALNAVLAAHFVASGLGAYLLARRFVASRLLAAVSGFVFAFCPFKLAHLVGHENLMMTGAIPFFVLGVIALRPDSARPRPNRRRALVAIGLASCLIVTLLCDYYYTYYLLWFCVLYQGYFLVRDRRFYAVLRSRWPQALAISVGSSTTLLLVSIHLLGVSARGAPGYSADIFALVVPSGRHWLLGGGALDSVRRALRIDDIEQELFLGFSLLALLVVFFRRQRLQELPDSLKGLLFAAAGFAALAMPVLRIAGVQVAALPTSLLHLVPFVKEFRVPARFAIMVMLIAPIIAMIAAEKVLARCGPRRRDAWKMGLVSLLLLEYAPRPYMIAYEGRVPRVYRELASRPDGVLLEIPFRIQDGYKSRGAGYGAALWFQTIHHKPMFGGMVARIPKATFDYYESAPIISELLLLQEGKAPPRDPARAHAPEQLLRSGLRYVVIAPELQHTPIEGRVEELFLPWSVSDELIDGFRLLSLRSVSSSSWQSERVLSLEP